MKLRTKCIGSTMTATTENGCSVTTTIIDDSKMFKFYKEMGFDVFEKKVKNESTKGDSK